MKTNLKFKEAVSFPTACMFFVATSSLESKLRHLQCVPFLEA